MKDCEKVVVNFFIHLVFLAAEKKLMKILIILGLSSSGGTIRGEHEFAFCTREDIGILKL